MALAILVLVLIIAAFASVIIFTQASVYLSVIAVGLALALQKYVASYFSYFVINLSKLFSPGDRIRIGNVKGDVKKIGVFHFTLDEVGEDEKLGGELTGRTLHIPNLIVLDQPVLNYSKTYSVKDKPIKCNLIFDEVRIPITTQSDLRQAVQLLGDIITEEDQGHLAQAKLTFGPDYPNFVREAEDGPRIILHVESQRVWLKGKFVTPYETRNQMKTQIYLRFIERTRQEPNIHLA
ncbi:MAG: mechanosensitive ion channel [Dehalococcoidia bacterium]|nr:mechanosensitive ion channel [Dehalococcoidia bacterium]